MDILVVPFLRLLLAVVDIYRWAVILTIFISLLQTLGVLNVYNRFIMAVSDFLFQITEPLLQPLRRILPRIGMFDLSPLVLILLLGFAQNVIQQLIVKMM